MWYTVSMSCGHNENMQFFGKVKDRERKIKYLEENGICSECYKAKKEQEDKELGLIFNAMYSDHIDMGDGSPLIILWFSGDSKSHKDKIKELGYHFARNEYENKGLLPDTAPLRWMKTIRKEKYNEEKKKVETLGAVKFVIHKNDMNVFYGKENQRKWQQMKEELNSLEEPQKPEIVVGHKWNGKVYGKSGNFSIYPDGEKIMISDIQADELEKYIKDKYEYDNKVEKIRAKYVINGRRF